MKVVSGRFVVRIPPKLHEKLRREALRQGISLNRLCCRRLAGGLSFRADEADIAGGPVFYRRHPGLKNFINKVIRTQGGELEGMMLFGSIARCEETENSDIDLLFVPTRGRPVARSIYGIWDRDEHVIDGHPVSVHYAKLPENHSQAGGLWYELALEGEVLWDAAGLIQKTLINLRGQISAGAVRRKWRHGHPYWIHDKRVLCETAR